MKKYVTFLKRTKARTEHKCNLCGCIIPIGEFYYAEELEDKFLHSLHRKKFCDVCYQKHGDRLLQS